MNMSRRTILKLLNTLGIAAIGTGLAVKNIFADYFPTRTVEKTEFIFDPQSGEIRWASDKREEFKLIVDGLVENPTELKYYALRALPLVDQVSDFHCVEGWTVPQVKWTGFRFKELLNSVKPDPAAEYVTFHSLGETHSRPQGLGHYVESFRLADLLDDDKRILLTLDKDGKPLSFDRGAPLRVIAPLLQAYKSIKFIGRVEFSQEKKAGWWTAANPIYTWEAKVSESRLKRGK